MARKKKTNWEWKAHAMREAPKRDAPTLVMKDDGSNQNGDMLFVLSTEDGGAPCLTAAEWRCLCVELVGFGSPVKA